MTATATVAILVWAAAAAFIVASILRLGLHALGGDQPDTLTIRLLVWSAISTTIAIMLTLGVIFL